MTCWHRRVWPSVTKLGNGARLHKHIDLQRRIDTARAGASLRSWTLLLGVGVDCGGCYSGVAIRYAGLVLGIGEKEYV
jgi:hypothetical protein